MGVVTRPDRPAGRGRRLRPTPVKEFALKHGLHLLEPERINAPPVVPQLRQLEPDLLVLAAYGQLLSGGVLALPRVAPVNVHPSLLPHYRGAAPVAWALVRGETETGVTIIVMDEDVDAGFILAQERCPIGPQETAGELEARLAELGARVLLDTLERLEEALAQARPQGPPPEDGSALALRLTKADGRLEWRRPAEELHNLIRGLTPWPGTYSYWLHDGELVLVKVLRARVHEQGAAADRPPGTVVTVTKEALLVQTGDGLLGLEEVQPAGGRAMEVSAFLRGHRVKEGDRFVDG